MERVDYRGPAHLRDMQSLVQRLWSPESRWHVGDVAWGRFAIPGAESGFRTSVWSESGAIAAWGWAELPGDLSMVVDPDYGGLADQVLAWFQSVARADTLSVTALQTETHLCDALEAAGYSVDRSAPYFTHHLMTLDNLPDTALPVGFAVRHVELHEAQQRAAVHRVGWSDFGSRVSTDSYQEVMAAWPYRADLDWVVEAPDGGWVASALAWLDDLNQVGLLEPVGCAPAYRRRGLARAVNVAALHALRRAGATRAVVAPRGDAAYPVPGRLYRSIGFQPGPRTVTYRRHA